MKILYVTARLPYPPFKGDQVRGYHQLRLLSRKHQITLLSFGDAASTQRAQAELANFCEQIILVPLKKPEAILRCVRGIFSPYPFQTLLYQSAQMSQALQTQLASAQFDLVHVQLARMAPYLQNVSHIPRVIDLIDALSVNMERRFQRDHGPMKLASYIEWQRMRQYERVICEKFDQATIVSASDRRTIGEFSNLHINANGVDLAQFPFVATEGRNPKKLVFSGNMNYFPNVNAVCWFVERVFPLVQAKVPDIQFDIVGVNPHADILKVAKQNRAITVTGYVEDIQAYLAQAAIAVVPMQSGSGMQFKVIESMACGTPVVATQYALGGIDVVHGEHLMLADTPLDFAEQVIKLLADLPLRQHLACNGRQLVEQQYSWEQTVADLERVHQLALMSVPKRIG